MRPAERFITSLTASSKISARTVNLSRAPGWPETKRENSGSCGTKGGRTLELRNSLENRCAPPFTDAVRLSVGRSHRSTGYSSYCFLGKCIPEVRPLDSTEYPKPRSIASYMRRDRRLSLRSATYFCSDA